MRVTLPCPPVVRRRAVVIGRGGASMSTQASWDAVVERAVL